MRRILAFIISASIGTALDAQPVTATVQMTNFKFAPSSISMKAGAPVLLQLRNDSSGGHSFSAPEFFAAARIDPASAGLVHAGRADVPSHQTVQVALVPAAGEYPLKCSHAFHSSFGMKGTIIVTK